MSDEETDIDATTLIDFLASQLYMRGRGGYGVRWRAMREDLQAEWRAQAVRVVKAWQADELERERARESGDPLQASPSDWFDA